MLLSNKICTVVDVLSHHLAVSQAFHDDLIFILNLVVRHTGKYVSDCDLKVHILIYFHCNHKDEIFT